MNLKWNEKNKQTNYANGDISKWIRDKTVDSHIFCLNISKNLKKSTVKYHIQKNPYQSIAKMLTQIATETRDKENKITHTKQTLNVFRGLIDWLSRGIVKFVGEIQWPFVKKETIYCLKLHINCLSHFSHIIIHMFNGRHNTIQSLESKNQKQINLLICANKITLIRQNSLDFIGIQSKWAQNWFKKKKKTGENAMFQCSLVVGFS